MKWERRISEAGSTLWPTPNSTDGRKWSNQSLDERKQKGQQVRLPTAVSPQGGMGGQLSADWTELLMGWPKGWSSLAPLDRVEYERWLNNNGGWPADWEDGTDRVASGVKDRVDRLRAIGNGQVPLTAATAWRLLTADLELR